ncbi:hypothetical protein IEQ34_008801 [Dendrobium chrysotoxum]|uniref:Uncharacterized protein n=1 Tax=Dendrobium chrysotoxum TaxID=161865 RepID=A0AAV7GYR3_DENCH|nr:hypothetical protein IEQ34_008801 [Dendrobium chrysotoxum]
MVPEQLGWPAHLRETAASVRHRKRTGLGDRDFSLCRFSFDWLFWEFFGKTLMRAMEYSYSVIL